VNPKYQRLHNQREDRQLQQVRAGSRCGSWDRLSFLDAPNIAPNTADKKYGNTAELLGDTKVPLQTGHLVLELVKLPPPKGEEERPDEELAEPVLARSKEEAEADDVADDTPEDDPIPENTWE